jgi:hypothetical protein
MLFHSEITCGSAERSMRYSMIVNDMVVEKLLIEERSTMLEAQSANDPSEIASVRDNSHDKVVTYLKQVQKEEIAKNTLLRTLTSVTNSTNLTDRM